MRFKVGDKVMVRKDLEVNKMYGADSFTSDMACMLGKQVTICQTCGDTYRINEWCYHWTDEMLEPIPLYASALIEAARANPVEYEGKRYKVVAGSMLYLICGLEKVCAYSECNISRGKLRPIDGRGMFLAVFSDTQLEPIPEPPKPVSFMEAVKAYSEGKTIRCEINKIPHKYIPNYNSEAEDDLGYIMLENESDAVSSAEILQGTWYIEE